MKGNPRKMDAGGERALSESIGNPVWGTRFFEARPLIVSTRTGANVVIAGNQRLRVAKKLGRREVPCVVLAGLNEAEEIEIAARDNLHNGQWDVNALAEWGKDAFEDFTGALASWGAEFDFGAPVAEPEQGVAAGEIKAAPVAEPEPGVAVGGGVSVGETKAATYENKEMDTSGFSDLVELKLRFTYEEMQFVNGRLGREGCDSNEHALLKILEYVRV